MSLILAIEPDPRQSTRLADLVRRRLSADLVQATTTEGALAALAKVGDRVPDLVLVPSLLSPQEDAAIAGALRIIAAAAKVRMLTIPMLADAEASPKPQGVFARLRGRKAKSVPGGCDPDVFADQIAAYLAEAAAERKAATDDLVDHAPAASVPTASVPTPAAVVPEPEPAYAPVFSPIVLEAPALTFVVDNPVVVAIPEPVLLASDSVPSVEELAPALSFVQDVVNEPEPPALIAMTPTVGVDARAGNGVDEYEDVETVQESIEASLVTPSAVVERDVPLAQEPAVVLPEIVVAQVEDQTVVAADASLATAVNESVITAAAEAVERTFEEPIVAKAEEPIVAPIEEAIAAAHEEPAIAVVEASAMAAVDEPIVALVAAAFEPAADAPVVDHDASAMVQSEVVHATQEDVVAPVDEQDEQEERDDQVVAAAEGPVASVPTDSPVAAIEELVIAAIDEPIVRAAEAAVVEQEVVAIERSTVIDTISAEVASVPEPLVVAPVVDSIASIAAESIVAAVEEPVVALDEPVVLATEVASLEESAAVVAAPEPMAAAAEESAVTATEDAIAAKTPAINLIDEPVVAAKSRRRFSLPSILKRAPKAVTPPVVDEADVDALIAPLLSEIKAKRSAFAREQEPVSLGATPSAREQEPESHGEAPARATAVASARPVPASPAAPVPPAPAPVAVEAPPAPVTLAPATPIEAVAPAPPPPTAPVTPAAPITTISVQAPEQDIDPMFFADDAMIVPPPTPAQAERSAWLELVESLRQDIERLKAERSESPAPAPSPEEHQPQAVVVRPRPAASPAAKVHKAAARLSRVKPRRPIEDQWGLFDPEQCGFAALLAKLDEISDRDTSTPA